MNALRKRHAVIDCDPGCDDALALLMAFNSGRYYQIDILTVAGNVGVNQTTENACRIAFLASRTRPTDVAIYKGCAASLDGLSPSAASVHGRDGLGDVPDRLFLNSKSRSEYLKFRRKTLCSRTSAVKHYLELFRNRRNHSPRDLICTGPLTNLASFLINLDKKEHSDFWETWRCIVLMTGALYVRGNISYHGEFNAYADPLALRIVLDSFGGAQVAAKDEKQFPKLCLVTLDITEKLNLLWEEIDIGESKRRASVIESRLFSFVSCMLQKYFLFHGLFAVQAVRYCKDFKPGHTVHFPCARRKCSKRDKACEDPDSFRRKKRDEFERARSLGSAGLKKVPRFCQLHDPLAVYTALNSRGMLLKEILTPISVYASPELGGTRGSIRDVEPRLFFFEIEPGTPAGRQRERAHLLEVTPKVQIIDEAGFMGSHEARFLRELKSAIGLRVP